jgi:plasmid stability protein
MPVMIQLRNVPDALHRKLKAQAASAGMSLSEYLLRIVRQRSDTPTPEQMWARLDALPRIEAGETPLEALHAGRRERERHLEDVLSVRPGRRKQHGK